MLYTLARENKVFSFDRDHPPALHVADGDMIEIETTDCFNGQIQSEDDLIPSTIDINLANPLTGPVYVDELEPGDGIALEIMEIALEPKTITGLLPGIGVLGKRFETRRTAIGMVEGSDVVFKHLRIPLRPMIGTIGTAPDGAPIPALLLGPHGGNMDHPSVTISSLLFLPVFVPGGLLALGDLHAAMGDGETTAISAEAAGRVTLRVHVLKNKPVKRARIKTGEGWITTGRAPNLHSAIQQACEDMVELAMIEYHLTSDDAAMLVGLCGNVQLSQCADVPGIDMSVRCTLPFLKERRAARA